MKFDALQTDENGALTIDGLIPGAEYRVTTLAPTLIDGKGVPLNAGVDSVASDAVHAGWDWNTQAAFRAKSAEVFTASDVVVRDDFVIRDRSVDWKHLPQINGAVRSLGTPEFVNDVTNRLEHLRPKIADCMVVLKGEFWRTSTL